MALIKVKRRGGRYVRAADMCRACWGDGFAPNAIHLGRNVWIGRPCERCDGTGKEPTNEDGND